MPDIAYDGRQERVAYFSLHLIFMEGKMFLAAKNVEAWQERAYLHKLYRSRVSWCVCVWRGVLGECCAALSGSRTMAQ